MFRLSANVEIKGDRSWSLDFVTAVTITRDTEKLTAEAQITLPKKMKWDGAAEIPVKRGDTVKISLGYDDDLQTAFVGYVRDVGFKTPITITCEDDMFMLKQMPAVKKAYRSVTLETLLKEQGITQRINVMGEQSLGAYRVTAETVASLLGKLSEQGIRSLPPKQRAILRMRNVEHLPYVDIAKILGTTESSVRGMMSKARLNLINQLKGGKL